MSGSTLCAGKNFCTWDMTGGTPCCRDVANVVMDLNDLENIEYRVLGGADTITVGDLTGTDVTRMN